MNPDGLLTSYPVVSGAVAAATVAICIVQLAVQRAGPGEPATPRGPIERLLQLALAGTVAVAAATSLGSIWTSGAMHGWPLLIHVAIGGALTGTLAAFAVVGSALQLRRTRAGAGPTVLARATFLALLVSGFLAAASMLVCTFPILGTSWMERMADLHRYAGLALAATTALHLAVATPRPAHGAADTRP
jgi:hypothetical protein